jgi:hypothetical protein
MELLHFVAVAVVVREQLAYVCMNSCIYVYMYVCMYGRKEGWMDGVGWKNACIRISEWEGST